MSDEKRKVERVGFGSNVVDEEKRADAQRVGKKQSKMSGKTGPKAGMTYYKGMKITVEERNMLMKMDYMNLDCDLKTLAEKYGITYGTIRTISSKGKWKEEREAYKQRIIEYKEGKIAQIYAGAQVEVNIMYNNAWTMIMELVYRELLQENEKNSSLFRKDGKLDIYALDKLADVLTKAQAGQYQATGFVGKEVQARIDLQEKQYSLKEKLSGIMDDLGEDITVDNFMDALDTAIAQMKDVNVDALVENDK